MHETRRQFQLSSIRRTARTPACARCRLTRSGSTTSSGRRGAASTREVTLPAAIRAARDDRPAGQLPPRVAGKVDRPFEGPIFNDTDVYKWLEAAAWALATDPTPRSSASSTRRSPSVAAAQQPRRLPRHLLHPGAIKEAKRWTEPARPHELYCAGHLIQAAVAHYRATGKTACSTSPAASPITSATRFGPAEEGKRAGPTATRRSSWPWSSWRATPATGATSTRRAYFIDARGHGAGRRRRIPPGPPAVPRAGRDRRPRRPRRLPTPRARPISTPRPATRRC